MTQPSQWPEQPDPSALPPQPPPSQAPPGATQPLYPGTAYGSATPPPYGYGQPGYGTYQPPPQGPRTNGLAIAAMVVSIVGAVGLCCYGLGGYIGAIGAVLGHFSRRQISRNQDAGGGMALSGIIIGWVATGIAVLATAFWAWFIITAAGEPGFWDQFESDF